MPDVQGCDTVRATRERTDVRRTSAARAQQTPAPERRYRRTLRPRGFAAGAGAWENGKQPISVSIRKLKEKRWALIAQANSHIFLCKIGDDENVVTWQMHARTATSNAPEH